MVLVDGWSEVGSRTEGGIAGMGIDQTKTRINCTIPTLQIVCSVPPCPTKDMTSHPPLPVLGGSVYYLALGSATPKKPAPKSKIILYGCLLRLVVRLGLWVYLLLRSYSYLTYQFICFLCLALYKMKYSHQYKVQD